MNRIKAVVLDCDGVMFDTAHANRKYYDEVLQSFGKKPLTDEQFKKVHMFTVKEALHYLFPERENLEDVYRCLKRIGYAKFIKYMQMAPGLERLLSNLQHRRIIRGVATNRTDTMEKVLAANDLTDQFDIVVTAADVEYPKPYPDQLIKIMERYDLNGRQVMFVGDSEYDSLAASHAGTLFVAFKNRSLSADFYVENMGQIEEILNINQ